MRTHAEIIADAGGYQKLADRIGQSRERVRFGERRASIPAEFWSLVAKHKVAGLTELSAAAAARREGEDDPSQRRPGRRPAPSPSPQKAVAG